MVYSPIPVEELVRWTNWICDAVHCSPEVRDTLVHSIKFVVPVGGALIGMGKGIARVVDWWQRRRRVPPPRTPLTPTRPTSTPARQIDLPFDS